VKVSSISRLFFIFFIKVFLLAVIVLHVFTPLNPVFGPMQAVIALAIILVLSVKDRLRRCLSLLADLIIALDLSMYFIELAPREFEAAGLLLHSSYSLLFLSLVFAVFALTEFIAGE